MLLRIPVYNDSPISAEEMFVDELHIDSVAKQSGLETWIPESVSYYACSDGAVLVIWGSIGGKTKIHGIVLPMDNIGEESHFKKVWARTKAKDLTMAEVHAAILGAQGQFLN